MVAINAFPGDHESEHDVIREIAAEAGARVAVSRHVVEGGEGARDLAKLVVEAAGEPTEFRHLYELDTPLVEKIESSPGRSTAPTASTSRRRWRAS